MLDFGRVFPERTKDGVESHKLIEELLKFVDDDRSDARMPVQVLEAFTTTPMRDRLRQIFCEMHVLKMRSQIAQRLPEAMSGARGLADISACLAKLWVEIGKPAKLQILPLLPVQKDCIRYSYAATAQVVCSPQLDKLRTLIVEAVTYQPLEEVAALTKLLKSCGFENTANDAWDEGFTCRIENIAAAEGATLPELLELTKSAGGGDVTRHVATAQRAISLGHIKRLFQLTLPPSTPLSPSQCPELIDLKSTMKTPELRRKAVEQFQRDVSTKLLNNGVDTVQILLMYLRVIEVFSFLDPRGVMLQAVTSPINRYLKQRSDTVPELVSGLFGEPTSPLRFLSDHLEDGNVAGKARDAMSWSDWTPPPMDAPADFVRQRVSDVVGTLMDLFEQKEVFIRHLALLFSSQLLELSDEGMSEGLDQLRKKAQALEQRFGPQLLESIHIMIQDVADSQHYMTELHKADPRLRSVRGLILNKLYWPHIKGVSTDMHLPTNVRELVDRYAAKFEELPDVAGQRHITWLADRGRVSVTLHLEDRQLDLVVLPEQAVLISAFDGKSLLSLSELVSRTGLPEPQLLNNIQFWVSHGVIGAHGEGYQVLETKSEAEAAAGDRVVSQVTAGAAQTDNLTRYSSHDDMKIYWSYIVGMLTNLKMLPVERIHSFLVMLVPRDDPYTKSMAELESFLLAMVDEDKLKLAEDKFSLP